jgi:hypothetical protein
MNNSHDEIKKLLKVSRTILSGNKGLQESNNIRKQYGLLTEQGVDLTGDDRLSKLNPAKTVEDSLEDEYETFDDGKEEKETPEDKKQGYRISGGIMVLHGKDQTELELTTDEKTAFQETMDEFVSEVSDMTEFNKLNLYTNNVEWSGKIIDMDIDFFMSIGEKNGVYINSKMIKVDDELIETLNKLRAYYEKFKSKWALIIASRKKTKKSEE